MIASRSPRGSTPPPVFGREEILEEADRVFTRANDGSGAALLLSGPGGVGKTQMLNAIVERAGKRGFTVLTGRALPEELPPAFSLLRRVLSSEPTESHEARVTPWAAGALPEISPVLTASGESARKDAPATAGGGSGPDEFAHLLAPLAPATVGGLSVGREELFARLERLLLERARARPLLIAIDDLHFGDTMTLNFLGWFASELPKSRIALAATLADSADVPERTREEVEKLSGAPGFLTMPVRSLTVPETEEFIRWILGGRSPSQDDVRRWHAQTDGNPLFVEQLVRLATGYTPPSTDSDEPGHGVAEMLLRRVDGLGDRERRVLTYAAVLGKEFHFQDLSAVAGSGEERVTESLDRLVQEGLLREKGGEVYEFVSEEVRRAIYAQLTETRRRILHARAGRALEGKTGTSDSELARHFYLGRDDTKAVEYNLNAARAATRDFSFQTAASHVARALEAERRRPDHDPLKEIRLMTEQGRLLEELGVLHRSDEILTEAVNLARNETGAALELGRALLALAQTRATRNEYESAEALATEALERLEKVGTPRDLMAGNRVLGIVAWRRGEFPRAERHQRAALDIAEREGTPIELGHALVELANTLIPVGATRIDPALELYGRAAGLFEKAGDFGSRARVLMNQSVLEYHVGRPDDAIRDLTVAIEAADRSRSPIWIGYCNLNLSQFLAARNEVDRARSSLARAVEVLAPLEDRLGAQQVSLTEGMIAEAVKDYATAESQYRLSLAQARELRAASEASEMLFRLARLAFERGDRVEARRWLAESRDSGIANFRPDFAERLEQLAKTIDPAG